MSKSTTDFKMYLNSIINDIDPKIHNELWNHLIAVISEEQQILNGETLDSGEICQHCKKYKRMQGNGILHQLCECGS